MFGTTSGKRYIYNRQQGKDKGLNEGYKNGHEHENNRNYEWYEFGEKPQHHVIAHYVPEKPDGKRYRAHYMAYDFDGEH